MLLVRLLTTLEVMLKWQVFLKKSEKELMLSTGLETQQLLQVKASLLVQLLLLHWLLLLHIWRR